MSKNKVNFYESKRVGPQADYEETNQQKEERELLRKLYSDTRNNCQLYDDGSRRNNANENASTATFPVINQPKRNYSWIWKAGAITVLGLAAIVAGIKGCDQEIKNEDEKAIQLQQKRSQELNDLYNSEEWKQGSKE